LCIAQKASVYSIRLAARLTPMRAVDSRMLTNSPSRPGTISVPSFVATEWPLTSSTFHSSEVRLLPIHFRPDLAMSVQRAWNLAFCSSVLVGS
jgi:hypothetical protein